MNHLQMPTRTRSRTWGRVRVTVSYGYGCALGVGVRIMPRTHKVVISAAWIENAMREGPA